jgi:adenylate kinase
LFFTLLDGAGISDLFSRIGDSASSKLLILGSLSDTTVHLVNRIRSLNLEHVSPSALIAQEISRRTALGQQAERASKAGKPVSDETLISIMRRWFWARKPDAGFVLTDFPATLLQARVFDEWLDARGEALDAVLTDHGSTTPLIDYYRAHGLLLQVQPAAA